MKFLLPDIYQEINKRSRILLLTVLCSLITTFSYAQFDFATETEPNNITTDSGIQTLTVANVNTTTIIGGGTVVGSDEDYWRIGRSPFSNGFVGMAVQSNSGSMQPEVWLETRTGSYDGPLVSNTLIHPGTDQSNRAMNLSYGASNQYYLIRVGGGRSGGYSYRVRFPRCDVPGLASILSTDPTETDFTITGIGGSSNISLVKVNTINSFTDPTSGTNYPTADGTAYSGSGEQTVYVGNSLTPNVTVTGLTANTTYYVKVFNYADCGGNLKLNAGNVFTVTTCGATPTTATSLELSANNESSAFISSITGTTGPSTRYVVKANTTNSFTAPTTGTSLPTANSVYGGGEQVVYAGDAATPNELITGLTTDVEHFFKVYTATLCGGTYYFEATGVSSSITPICSPPNSNSGIYLLAENTTSQNSIRVVNFTGNNNADGKIIYISDTNNFTLPTTLPLASFPTASTDYSGKTGQSVIYTGAATGFGVTTTGLSPNTTYYFAAVNYKLCNGVYYFFPTGVYSQNTTCGIASELASNAVVSNVDATSMNIDSFTASAATVNAPKRYVIKMNTVNSFSPIADGTPIPVGNPAYAGGEQIIYSGLTTPNVTITGLTEGTPYYFAIYGLSDCSSGFVYQQTPYTFSQSTLGLNLTAPTLAYGSGATTLSAITNSTGAISYSLVNDTTGASLVGSDITPGNIGTTTVRVTVAADGIYQGISEDYSVNIVKGNPVITWNTPPNINVGEPLNSTHLNASANVPGTFEYYRFYNSFNNTFSQRITSGVTSLTTSGNPRIYTRFVPDDTNYNIVPASTTITVNNDSVLEITAADAIKALGSADPALTYSLTSGQLNLGDKIWVPLTREPGETEGTYIISIDQTAQAPASFDRSGVCPPGVCIGKEDPFGDEEEIISTTGDYTLQLQTGTFTITSKEQVTITLDRFDLFNTFYNGNPRNPIDVSSIVVTNTGSTATPAPALNYVYSGNDFLGNPYGPSTTSPTNAGYYAVTTSVDEADPNFFGSVTANFTISRYDIAINPDNPQIKAFDGTPKTFDVNATGLSGENIPLRILYDIDPGFSTVYDEAPPTEARSYTVFVNSWESPNYNINYNGILTITDKTLVTINLTDLTQPFDGAPKPVTISSIETSPGVAATPTPTVNVSYRGINGTSYSQSLTPPTFAGEYQVTAQVDVADANFAGVTHQVLTIQDKTLVTFTFDPADLNVTYNGNAQGVDIVSIKDVNGIDVTPTYTVMYDGEDIDGNTYGPSATPPTDAGNYTIVAEVDAADPTYRGRNEEDFTINQIALTLTADAKSKTYGDTDPALTYQLTSGALLGSDAISGDLSRVAGENVGTYSVQQGTVTAGVNYNITFVSNDVTIGQRAIEVTADAQSKIYGDADPALTYQITSGNLVGSDAFTGIMTRVVGENAGTYAIEQDTFTAGANYNLTFISSDVTITTRAIEITADAKSKTYGDPDPALTYQITAGSLQFSDVFGGSLSRVAGENVGTYAIDQGTLTAGPNYALTYVSDDLTIGQRAIEITADAKSKNYGDADPALTYQITSGGLQFSDSFTGNLSRTAGENVGTYAINQGTLSTGSNYTVTYIGNDLTIGQRTIEITADALNKTYGDADPALTYQVTSGSLVFSDAFTGSLTRVAGENVGNYVINQGTVALNANYNLSYVSNDLTIGQRAIEVTADAKSKTYGDADPALTYQVTSGNLVGSDSFIGIMTRIAGENVGTYAILQDTFTAGANYNITFVSNDLTIGQRAVEVTAEAKTKIYGDADPSFTYQVTAGALQFSDAFTGALSRDAGQAQGNYAINQGTLSLGANYDLTFVPGNLYIDFRFIRVIPAAPISKVYGDADPDLTWPHIITQGSLAFDDALETYGTFRQTGENVGRYQIRGLSARFTSSNGGQSSYAITYTNAGSVSLDITARAIEVTADAQSKAYGDADPTLSYQITNGALQLSDAFTGALSRATGEDVGIYAINQGTLSAGTNYIMTYVGNDLTIGQRAIEVTADALNKAYGDADPALNYQITSGALAFSDAFTGNLTRMAGETLGNYAINQGTLALDSNYNLTYISNDLTIGRRTIEITADVKSKIYGDTDPALTYQITNGSLAGSDVISGSLTRIVGEDAGTYAIQQGSIAINANYAITYVSNNLTIGQRAIEVTADTKSKTYGDVDPVFTYQITNGALQFSDALSGSLLRVTGEDVGNYAIQQGSVTAGGNYNLTFIANDLVIGQRAIEITADAKSKTYGDPEQPLTYQITSGNLVGSDALTGNLERVVGEDVGTYAINQGTLDNLNYAITFISNDYTITIRNILIAPNILRKVYGDVDPELTYSVLGPTLVFGDTFSGNLERVTGESVGSYAINQGTLSLSSNYSLTVLPSRFTIDSRSIEITADDLSKIIGSTDPEFTYQITSGALQFSDVITGSLTRISGEALGNYAINQGTLSLGSNYDLTFISGNLNITDVIPQAITFGPLGDRQFGDADFALNATGGASGNPVTFVSSNTAVATISGNTVTIIGAGTTTITASQAGNATYAAATDIAQTLTINKAGQTITFDTLDTVVVGAPDFNLNAAASSGLAVTYTSSDPSVAAITGNTVTIIGIGTTTITASQGGDSNWNPANDVRQVLTVVEGCPLADLPIDNFQIQTASETCADKNNGNILINAVANLDYVATVNNETYNFTSRLLITDLAPGKYPVCIRINGFANCEQCFEMEIGEAPILDGKTTVSNGGNNKQVFVEIETGTAPFTVMLNDQFVGEYDSNSFLINAQNGDKIEVTSSVACEGKLSTTINPFDQMSVFPNPTKANVTMTLPKFESSSVIVSIHNTLGTMVSSKVYNVVGSRVQLPMENLPTGIYFVTVEDGISQTFKIIKE